MAALTFAFLLPAAPVAQPLLSLDDALHQALDANRVYRMSEIDARTAANSVSWGSAGLLPKVDATAGYNRSLNDTRQQRVGSPTDVKNNALSTATTAGVNGTWAVFEGLSSLAAHDRLASTAAAADQRKEQARQDLAAQVILAYGDAVRQKSILAAMDSAVAYSEERVRITEGQYKIGSTSKLELLQAELDRNADRSAQLKQAVSLGTSKRNLNRILAREDSLDFDVADSIPLSPLPPFGGLRDAALEQSPLLRQAEQGKRVAAAGYREYVGHLFPSLGLSVGYNYGLTESQAGFITSNEALGWNYGANLKFNLFDGFSVNRDYRNARETVTKAELQVEDARAQVQAGLAEAHEAYRASLEVLDLETSNMALARENVGIAMERLRLGTIASLELRAAQEKFVDAETRLVSARYESKRAETELLRIAGRLAPR